MISETTLKYLNGSDLEGDAYQLTLYTLALGLNAQLIYEWGVGVSTLAFLRAVQRTGGKVVSCDTNDLRAELIRRNAPDMMARWHFFHTSSEELRPLLEEQADLIYIDGTHSPSCVQWEVEAYWPLLKPDGLMVLHDTRTFPDGPGMVARKVAQTGVEMVELPYSCGLAIIHKCTDDPAVIDWRAV